MQRTSLQSEIFSNGFTIVPSVYSVHEVASMCNIIENASKNASIVSGSKELYAIRQVLQKIPGLKEAVFTETLKGYIHRLFGPGYFIVKSIYFDKPEKSNWFVAYHQDLTVSVDRKSETEGYTGWTLKDGYHSVQPPSSVLENIFTIRIHLDDTDAGNGALKVIKGSHLHGVIRADDPKLHKKDEMTCEVPAGGIMIMKPMLFHASARSQNQRRRRVIHIEFSNNTLANGMQWAEKI